jgi:ubiquinone/menaquinone biosynthesis C-methylase UbiE
LKPRSKVRTGLTPHSFIGDAAHVLLPDRSIDCILLASVIGLIQDPIDLLREVFRILKPTGHVIIADPFDAFYDYDCPSDHRLTTNGVLQLVEQVARGGCISD